jgi:small conductance mechanosensitive channel
MPKSLSDLTNLTNVNIGSFSLTRLLSAAAILLVCLLIIRILMRLVRRLFARSTLDDRVKKYLIKGIRALFYFITVLIVVDALGIPTTSLVALLSVGSLGVTLAAEDILGNVAGGLVILSSRPFAIGDFIEADGTSGTVEDITLNHTKLVTPAGLVVLLPNKALSGSQMTNYSSLGRRRVSQTVTASYDAPTATVKAACFEALKRTDKILEDPAPSVYLTEYGSSSISYTIYCWTLPGDYWDVYYALGEELRNTFAEAGVEMTYDHLNVHIVENRS